MQEPPAPAAPVAAPAKTTEFAVLIDNSRSIGPREQVIIREATQLLADLADKGDRIAVISFGEQARLVTSVQFQGDADRRAFKEAIRQGLDFRERFSDLRAGLRLLAERRESLFPTPGAMHAAVLFSDGRLEPRNTPAPQAFQQLLADLQGPLEAIEVYAVVLGDTTSRQPIPGLTPPLAGYELMRQRVARAPEYFYHARQLEQLPEVAVTILNKTKGIASLGEESGNSFRIDHTVHALTLIVRKRPPGAPAGSPLPEAQQIELQVPETAAPTGETLYRSSDYQHFDLFVVRHPRPGLWKVTRRDGGALSVLSKIVSPIRLQVQHRPYYFLNEAAAICAWLWDEDKQAVAADDYQLQAHIATPGGLAASPHYLPLHSAGESGQYCLSVPAELTAVLGSNPAPEQVELESLAQQPSDPWFLRRSQSFTVALWQPLIDWITEAGLIKTTPFCGFCRAALHFGGALNDPPSARIGFEVPPELAVVMERFDPENNQYSPVFEERVKAISEANRLVFRLTRALPDYGDYRYGYRLAGNTPAGPFTIQSPWYPLRIQFFWELAALAAVILLILVQFLSSLTAKLRGQLQIERTGPNPGFEAITVRPSRCVTVPIGAIRLRVCARRYLFLFKRLCLRLTGAGATLDGRPLESGKTRCVAARGTPTLNFPQEGGTVTVKLILRV